MPISFNRRASREVTRIAEDYEAESPGLGEEFPAELDHALDAVERHGQMMARVRDDIRLVKLKRFPYGVYYRLEGDSARVLIVKHHRRHPDYGLDRT